MTERGCLVCSMTSMVTAIIRSGVPAHVALTSAFQTVVDDCEQRGPAKVIDGFCSNCRANHDRVKAELGDTLAERTTELS